MAMDAKANWIALRNYTALAVSLHRYDTAPLFASLHSVARKPVDHPPVNIGPPDIDASVDDDPSEHGPVFTDTPTPPTTRVEPTGVPAGLLGPDIRAHTDASIPLASVETAPVVDNVFGLSPLVSLGLTLTTFVGHNGTNAADSISTTVFDAGVPGAPLFTDAIGLSTTVEDTLAAGGSSLAQHERTVSTDVAVDTLLDPHSTKSDAAVDASRPPQGLASVASG